MAECKHWAKSRTLWINAIAAALVALEVDRGLVSREGARRYGVVLTSDGEVDEEATKAARDQLRAQRGDTKMFDFGPDLDRLRAACQAETGLPAPQPPVFR